MAGGNATHSGIIFQDSVAAYLAVHLLADQPVDFLDLGSLGVISTIELETTSPVDDLVVSFESGGYGFFNAKTSVSVSQDPKAPLGSVVDQFVRQWLVCRDGDGRRKWDRPLDASRDRLVLATKGKGSKLVRHANPMLKRIKDHNSLTLSEIAVNDAERRIYEALISLVTHYWERHTGESPQDRDLIPFFSLIRVVGFDFDAGDTTVAQSLLRQAVLARPSDAETAWNALIAVCHEYGEQRRGGDQTALRQELRKQGIALSDSPEFASEIARLKDFTRETLDRLAHLARLDVPTPTGHTRIKIPRACSAALKQAASKQSFLVIGEPGAGKSGALHAAATELIDAGHPVVVITVDRHPVSTSKELQNELGLQHSLERVLEAWASSVPGIIFIDALDATRGGPSETVFQDLIRVLSEKVPNWNIVASIRRFDLRFGQTFRELFRGAPVDSNFADPEFSSVRHLLVPILNDQELQSVWERSPAMAGVFNAGSNELKHLLRSPFNLFLLSTVLVAGGNTSEFIYVSTQIELLDRYWTYRVIAPDRVHSPREALLRFIAEKMIETRALFVSSRVVDRFSASDLEHLYSGGVLSPLQMRGDQIVQIAFSHHMLFDYAVARLVFEAGHSSDFVAQLTASDDNALLLAPAAMLALRMLWHQNADRTAFWQAALAVARAKGAGAFCRMLPARVAAEMTSDPSDYRFIIDEFRRTLPNPPPEIRFLIFHTFGALLAGVHSELPHPGAPSPWPSIIRMLAEHGGAPVLIWPLMPAVRQWVKQPDQLRPDEKRDVGAAARLLLQAAIADPYDEAAVASGIQGVIRTFDSDALASAAVLRTLLTPDHVRAYGHRELFWIGTEFESLLAAAPEVVADVYRAAYCTPLPSRGEETSLGQSRILPLTSNKRQDFQGARYQLGEKFSTFVSAAPAIAANVLIDAVEFHVKERFRAARGEEISFQIYGIEARFVPDGSAIWWEHSDDGRESDDVQKLLNEFIHGLNKILSTNNDALAREIIDVVARRNRYACTWAAMLYLGAQQPKRFGVFLTPLLLVSAVLDSSDSRYAAGELIKKLHPILPVSDRRNLENTIISLGDENTRNVLLGCLSPGDIVTDSARNALNHLSKQGSIPQNRPAFSIRTSWRGGDDNWWLKEQGVDVEDPFNAALLKQIAAVEAWSGGKTDLTPDKIAASWGSVTSVLEMLSGDRALPEALQNTAWHAVAKAATQAAEAARGPDDLAPLERIESAIFGALDDRLWPPREKDPEAEEQFEKSTSWSSPAPRVEAAAGVMALARARGRLDDKLRSAILRLSVDPVPAVRHQILIRISFLFAADPNLMRQICEQTFAREQNRGVLTFFLEGFRWLLDKDPYWAAEKLVELHSHLRSEDTSARWFLEIFIRSLLRLWLVHDIKIAEDIILRWASNPVEFSEQTQIVLGDLRDAIVQGDPAHPDSLDDRVRQRSVQIFTTVIERAASEFNNLVRRQRSENEQKQAENALCTLDLAAAEIYFGSGAYAEKDKRDRAQTESDQATFTTVRARFLAEMAPALDILAGVPHPAITHHLLETLEFLAPTDPITVFKIMIRALLEGGRDGGYQYESLGAQLFVTLVRRYLADYRSILAEHDDCRRDLIRALDVFVEAGWPEARQLVYDLPETLR